VKRKKIRSPSKFISTLPDRIVLIGYRACGKTSVGSELASRLSWRFVDVDDEIEREEGRSIDQIVADRGWEGFRAVERAIIKKLCKEPQFVMAPGGGAVLNAQNVANLKRKSRVFWLQADAETHLSRMEDDPLSPSRRPPLTGLSPEKEVQRLLKEREPYYKEASNAKIDTRNRSIPEVVEEILTALES
jgi:shikimate kinase